MSQAKSVWITGASSGIGYSLCMHYLQAGWLVYATARNTDSLDEAKILFPEYLVILPGDITSPAILNDLSAYFSDKALHLAIINAGNCLYMENATLNRDALRSVYDINLFAAVETSHIALHSLTKQFKHSGEKGLLIGVSSMSVLLPFTQAEYYASSKIAFDYYLQSLRIDTADQGTDISICYPGFVKTPLTEKNDFPMPFIISSEKAAQCIAQLYTTRKAKLFFPKRMHALLTLFKCFPRIWFSIQRKSAKSK